MKYVIYILSIVVVFLLYRAYNSGNKINDLKQQADLEKSAKDTLQFSLDKKSGEWEYSKQALTATNDQLTVFLNARNAELAQLKKTKKAIVGIITKTETKIDTTVTNIPPEKTTGVDPTIQDSIRKALITTNHYKADIISWPKRTSLALTVWDSVRYSVGPEYRLVAHHSNPYVKVTELNSFYVKPDIKKRNWKYIAGALIGGALMYGITR